MRALLFAFILLSPLFLQASSSEEEGVFYSFSSGSDSDIDTEALERQISPYATCFSASLPDQFWGITNQELEELFTHSNDLVCIIDYGGELIRVNKKWKEILGYEESELTGKPYKTFIHPEDQAKTKAYEQKCQYTGLVNRYRCHNGLYRWLDWMGIPYRSQDTILNYRLAVARDITLYKLYQQELILEPSLSKTRKGGYQEILVLEAIAAVQATQVGELMRQEGGGENSRTLSVILQNFIQLTESSFGFIGEIFYDLQQQASFKQQWRANTFAEKDIILLCADNNVNAVQGIGFDPFFKRVVEEKKPLIFHNLEEAFKGQTIASAYRSIKNFLGIPLFNRGELTGVVGLSNHQRGYNNSLLKWLKPLTLVAGKATGEAKQNRLQHEIDNERRERIRAEQANHTKTLFIAHMSHELRTPLTGVIGNLDLIPATSFPEKYLTYFKNAQLSAQSLLYIANDILDVAKLEAGVFKLEEKEFDLRRALQETLDILHLEIEAKELKFQMTLDPKVPEKLIGDALRLRQIVFNLLNNALKFTQVGSIHLSFDIRPDFQKQDQLILSGQVRDTGIGMKKKTISNLFQPFSQGDNSLYRQFGGTGLGLHITRQLCEAMGGCITVQSEFGQGSIFSFDITVRQQNPQPVFVTEDNTVFPALNILVADDNAVIQKVFKATLTKLGCNVTIAPNGLDALNAVKAGSYDVVLMDGEMPIMDGLEATRQIRTFLGIKPLPIIGVTAHALTVDRARFLAAGMDGYLTKPVKLIDLKAEILRCLALHNTPIPFKESQ